MTSIHNPQEGRSSMRTTQQQGRRRPGKRTMIAAGLAAAALTAGGVALASSASAGSNATPAPHVLDGFSVTASQSAVKAGDTVTMTIQATAASDLYAYDVTFGYDPAVLQYVASSATTDVSGATYASGSAGSLSVIHTKLGTSPAATGQVTLATLSFKALSVGSTTVQIPTVTEVSTADATTKLTQVASTDLAVTALAAPTATRPATVTGSATVGHALQAHAPTWSLAGVTTGYQWLKDGKPIPGAVAAAYTVQPGDAGGHLAVTVTADKQNYATGTITSAATAAVAKAGTHLSAKALGHGGRIRVKATVTAYGVTPAGTVKVKVDGRKAGHAATLKNGTATVKVALRKHGRHTVKVTYVPAPGFTGGSHTLKVRS
jgi:hypothetical protein